MDDELTPSVGFSLFSGIGPMRFTRLVSYFGSAAAAWQAGRTELIAGGIPDGLADSFCGFRRTADIGAYLARAKSLGVAILPRSDVRYPDLLRNISDAPIVLHVRGKRGVSPIDLTRTVGVVGSRKISRYGAEVTRDISEGLAGAGVTVVSGMAFGADTIAHKSALAAGGATVAVLGCGVDIAAPASNGWLYREIIESGRGAVVSEMPLGVRPSKLLFPVRNRIIAGLSLGTVVTEGTEHSGALITASYAASQGREVFAVPGPVTSVMSRAPLILLRNGAALVERAEDVLSVLGIPGRKPPEKDGDEASSDVRRVTASIAGGHKHVDDIVRESGLTAQKAAAILTVLEIEGKVRNYGDYIFGLVKK